MFRRAPSPKGSPLRTARPGEDRPAAATARTSCSWSVRGSRFPMLLIAAADARREAEREREREREKLPRRAVSAGRHLRRQRASAAKKTTHSRRGEQGDTSANYSAAEQHAHAPAGFHSAGYRRAACVPSAGADASYIASASPVRAAVRFLRLPPTTSIDVHSAAARVTVPS